MMTTARNDDGKKCNGDGEEVNTEISVLSFVFIVNASELEPNNAEQKLFRFFEVPKRKADVTKMGADDEGSDGRRLETERQWRQRGSGEVAERQRLYVAEMMRRSSSIERQCRRRARETFEEAAKVWLKGGPYKEWSDARLEHGVVFVSLRGARRWSSCRREPLEEAAHVARRATHGHK
ncbi:hypothetical protein RHGRI_020908 [Rhododendron griersonianum]|uniref:Uncharacterized protein n=1 Tax=Rhododendron griersonianum TaxID=479676 RepID=A0AAV6JL58_9ERIC|nr:hypothetical protein RHGRI_020908 [Rhododendron griersonianum]